MKVRESGMPEQDYWESLFDIDGILDRLGIDKSISDAVEVGCGYGTFTVPVARRIGGALHAFDIDAAMVAATRRRVAEASLQNVHVALRDTEAEGFGLASARVDAVLLFNILHAESPVAMLRSSAHMLRPAGRVLAVHWRSDLPTPRGPSLSIRPRPEQIAAWAATADLTVEGAHLLPPWHFGLVLRAKA